MKKLQKKTIRKSEQFRKVKRLALCHLFILPFYSCTSQESDNLTSNSSTVAKIEANINQNQSKKEPVVNVDTDKNGIPIADFTDQWLSSYQDQTFLLVQKNAAPSKFEADVIIKSGDITFREFIKSNENGEINFIFPDDFVLGEEMSVLQELGDDINGTITININDQQVFKSNEKLSTKRKNNL